MTEREKMCIIISEAVGGWNQNTPSITRVADALILAGFHDVAPLVKEIAWLRRQLDDLAVDSPRMGW